MIDGIQSAQISQKQDGHNIYAIMKTMCPLGYHHNGFEATHALGHMMYGIYTYVCIYTVYIYIYKNLPVNAVVDCPSSERR